jgi:predicted nucleotidyltransferase
MKMRSVQGVRLEPVQQVDEAIIQEVVRRVIAAVAPERIVLFGSYAYGTPHPESDLDILVVMKSELPRYQRAVPIYQALTGLLISKDVLVYTPEEVEAWNEVPEALITTVVRQGKVLYEKDKE